MRIQANYTQSSYNTTSISTTKNFQHLNSITDVLEFNLQNINNQPSFKSQILKHAKDYLHYQKVKHYTKAVAQQIKNNYPSNFPLRDLSMEALEGLQYGIKVFKGLSMKDIQYLSENLHVIAVNRGCTNLCSHCYADAKPSKRAMSWEDFTSITEGFKTMRERLCGLPLFGETMTKGPETLIYRSTELFYDADCINLEMLDKKGKSHDFIEMVNAINAMGRKSVFDTSGWNPSNDKLQKRAEKYTEYFSHPENMEKLNQFNLSFNVFNVSYVEAVKALKAGNKERYQILRQKFVDRIANAIFTFTPILKQGKLGVLTRAFGPDAKNAKHFNIEAMRSINEDVIEKLSLLYTKDLEGRQKYIKTENDIYFCLSNLFPLIMRVDTGLNSVGRMKEFMKAFKIKAPMQDHSESTKTMINDLIENGRHHRYLAHKLIDTDGKVYHMDYARFFPTEIQLNIENKGTTPPLANLNKDFVISKELINQKEYTYTK